MRDNSAGYLGDGAPGLSSCPFCNSHTRMAESINLTELMRAYSRRFGLKIGHIVAGIDRLEFRRCQVCDFRFFYPPCPADGDFYAHLSEEIGRNGASTPDKPEFMTGARYVREGDAVLDVGCGKGVFGSKIPAGTRYVGLEINPTLISTGGLDIRPEPLGQHASFHKEKYDVVCSFQVLEHVPDPVEFLRLSASCVKPGGTMVVSVPNADGFVGGEIDNILNMPPHHLTWWDRQHVERIADILHMEILEIVEEPLSESDRKAFLKMLTLNLWRRWMNKSSSQFVIGGGTYRVGEAMARAAARLLVHAVNGIEFTIKGHSITGVYRKRRL